MTVLDDAAAIQPDLVALRRALHQEPEVGLHLPRTQDRVLAALDGLPLEVHTGSSLTSVTAVLRGDMTGERVVLLRGDMDALPVRENSGVSYAATAGQMHACGHDLHTVMLVGAARVLCARRGQLAGSAVFMFQPGEEGHDGARHMLDEGVLDVAGRRADAALALHVVSGMLPSGVFASRGGPVMSASDILRVTVRGTGGHGASPHRSRDPVPAACEMVTALQALVTRRFDVFDPVVLTVGVLRAGTRRNVIPDEAYFEATLRSFSGEARQRLLAESVNVCRGVAAAHGLRVDAIGEPEYPVTVNDASQLSAAQAIVEDLHGQHRWTTLRNPMTGSEDFSRILGAIPGAMVFLGACPPERDPATAPFNHSAQAVFDDSVLAEGVSLYAEFAKRQLSAHHMDRSDR